MAKSGYPVVVYAEDTDILALLLYHWQSTMAAVFFKTDGKAKRGSAGKCIDIGAFQSHLGPEACSKVLALHAFGGCDTASAIFGHGRGKLFTRLASARELGHHVHILQQPQVTKDEVCDAGVALMVALYNGQPNDTLGQMRYRAYSKVVAKAGTFVADRLPPTADAAMLHAMRAHLQAVFWASLGKTSLTPTQWGWHVEGGKMHPIFMQCQPGPPEVMKIICCSCKSKQPCSSQLCTCRKHGMKCIAACGHCHGTDCDNAETVAPVLEDSDIEVDDEQMGALLIADSELDWIDEEDVVASGDFVFDLEITADIRLKVEDEEIC